MSETSKTAETAKRATDQTPRASQPALDAAGKSTRAATNETNHVGQNSANHAEEAKHAEEVSQSMTETVAETATNLSTKAAEQGHEVIMMAVRTAAGVGSRVADIGFGRGHHLLASTTNAMDIYREASERSAERIQALFSSYMTVGRGWQSLQRAWLEMIDHSIENAAHKPQDMLRCKNMVELAEVQRDLYIDAINHAVESTSRLMDIAGRTMQDAVRPLQSHTH